MRVLELYVQLLIARTGMGDYWPEGLQDVANLVAAFAFNNGRVFVRKAGTCKTLLSIASSKSSARPHFNYALCEAICNGFELLCV